MITIIDKNIATFLHGASYKKRLQLRNKNLVHTLYAYPEFSDAWSRRTETITDATIKNKEILSAAQKRGRGVIVVGFHTANLEIGFYILNAIHPSYCTYQEHSNPAITQAQYDYRTNYALGAIKSNHLRTIITSLQNNQTIWIAPDQGKHSQTGICQAPLFSVTVPTLTTISRLAAFTGSEVIVMHTGRDSRNYRKHHISFKKFYKKSPGTPSDDAKILNQHLEEQINSYPEQYFWLYRIVK